VDFQVEGDDKPKNFLGIIVPALVLPLNSLLQYKDKPSQIGRLILFIHPSSENVDNLAGS
jgi:hypothetical protein